MRQSNLQLQNEAR